MSSSIVFCRICGSSLPLTSDSTVFCCDVATKAFQEGPVSESRIRKPRVKGQDVSWDDAFKTMTKQIEQSRKTALNAVGLYTGRQSFWRGFDWMESLLFSTHIGSTSWFTDLCLDDASRLLVTEWMVGHATPLLSDLGRAHNIIILGDNPDEHGWGMLQPDHQYHQEIKHSQQTKHTKVTFVSANAFESKISAQKRLVIRPGTEPFFLLGMLRLVLNNGWYDKQYVEKYTLGLEKIKQLIAPFTVSRCAELCGIKDADISGITLKWVRSAMSLIHLTPGALRCEHSTLGAWAWMCLHALSANALRPGGIYEAMGTMDLLPVLVSLRSDNAPKSQVGGQALLLGQNMSSHLLLEIERGNIETLILLDTPKISQYDRFQKALNALSCSIVISDVENELTKSATIVLPRSTPWEESDILLHRNNQFSTLCLPTSTALHPQFDEAKSARDILNTLSSTLSFKWTGSDIGLTNRLLAKQIERGGQEKWIDRAWGLINEHDVDWNGSLNYQGEHDRALWRPSQDKIQLAPPEIEELFRHLQFPQKDTDFPYSLHSSHTASNEGILITAHPDCGFQHGASMRLRTRFGSVEGTLVLSEQIHPNSILCSAHTHSKVLNLLPTNTDLASGAPVWNGVSCQIESI